MGKTGRETLSDLYSLIQLLSVSRWCPRKAHNYVRFTLAHLRDFLSCPFETAPLKLLVDGPWLHSVLLQTCIDLECFLQTTCIDLECFLQTTFIDWECFLHTTFIDWECFLQTTFIDWECFFQITFIDLECFLQTTCIDWECFLQTHWTFFCPPG